MKITAIETVWVDEFPTLIFVQIHTDDGHIGLGETSLGVDAVEAYIHETVVPRLLGQDPLQIDRHSKMLYESFVGFGGTSVEARGNSAIDIGLWDLYGKVTGLPLYQLLGGAVRDKIRIYNTCAG